MFTRSLTFKQLSIKQRALKIFRISYIRHFYRFYIKANALSLIHKYHFNSDFLRRYKDYRGTRSRYKKLKNRVKHKIKVKKIFQAWKIKNYNLFLRLGFLFIFAWPIWAVKKITNLYFFLKNFIKSTLKTFKK